MWKETVFDTEFLNVFQLFGVCGRGIPYIWGILKVSTLIIVRKVKQSLYIPGKALRVPVG